MDALFIIVITVCSNAKDTNLTIVQETTMTTRAFSALLQVSGLLSTVTAVSAIKLNEDNYEKLTAGKIVFLKFYDPKYVSCHRCHHHPRRWIS
jgi:hypothetical protein